MGDRSKALRAKLCIEDVCQFDEGCGCLEAIDEAIVPLRAEIERLTARQDAIADRAYGNGILHGLKLAEAEQWDEARRIADRLIDEARRALTDSHGEG